MSTLNLESVVPWAPHPSATPVTARPDAATLRIAANGTRTCVGGWQAIYSGVVPGQTYEIVVEGRYEGLEHPRDCLECTVHSGMVPPNSVREIFHWDWLVPEELSEGRARFSRLFTIPAGATHLTVRYTFRWSKQGGVVWQFPRITPVERPVHRTVRICVATGELHDREGEWTVQRNLTFYSNLCERAAQEKPNLIVLPEVCLQWQVMPRNWLEQAVCVPGPETDVFARIAARYHTRIVLGTFERDGDAVFNSALLISPEGVIDGRYHKVHLAVLSESDCGVLPGDSFPVYDTEIGRIGCNICMDSSAAESSRMIGLNGADYLVLPIMGDHRADRWTIGRDVFNEGRWRAIQRTRAMDNQLIMVIARNTSQGSCIIDRKGEILAWNEGDRDYILADVNLDDGYRTFGGGYFRSVNWIQRRPHIYGPFVDENNWGNLGPATPG